MSTVLDAMKKIKVRADIPSFLKANALNGRIAEIGVRFGYNFQSLAAAQPELLIGIDHYAVTDNPAEQDTGMGQSRLDTIYSDTFTRFLHNPAVKIYRGTSQRAAEMFDLMFFDYVYIDADHTKEGALRDINSWWSRVRQGGVIAGHDYIDAKSQNGVEFGVIEAVKEFMAEKEIPQEHLHFTEEGYRSWMILKIDGE